MKIQRMISTALAAGALATVSVPALAWTAWPDIDFEWYADVGKPTYDATFVEITPAPRAGYIWSPGHWENRREHQVWAAGHFVRDDFEELVAAQAALNRQGDLQPSVALK